MTSSTWNFTVAATSPMFSYNPYTSNISTGWQTYCTGSGYRCDDNTAHVTGTSASVSLSFNGTGIAFYGNVTNSMTVTAKLEDGTTSTSGIDASSQVLASFSGLEQKNHTVTLTANPSSPVALLYFTQAVVTIDTGFTNTNVTSQYIDDVDPSIVYGPYWNQYPSYTGTLEPPGIKNSSFHASRNLSVSALLRLNASAILLYGPCYDTTGTYTVRLVPFDGDGDLTLTPTTPYADVGAGVMENCLRFFATGMDPSVERELTLQSVEDGWWATLDYIQLVGFSGSAASLPPSGGSGGNSTPTPNTGSAHSTAVGAITGGVVGGVCALAILAIAILLFIRRRRRRESARHIEPFRPRASLIGQEQFPPSSASAFKTPLSASVLGSHRKPTTPSKPHVVAASPAAVSIPSAVTDEKAPPVLHRPTLPDASVTTPSPPQTAQEHASSSTSALPLRPITSASTLSLSAGGPLSAHPILPALSSAAATNAPSPSLSKISNDVNRIIAELGRLGRPPAPGGTGDELDEDEEGEVMGTNLPSYDEARAPEGNIARR